MALMPRPDYTVLADPITTGRSFSLARTMPQTVLQPVSGLSEIYVNKLRPYGTYANTYAPGQCTYGVASRLPIPNNWGNADNWAFSANISGDTVSNIPKDGSIAQTSGDSYLGHVSVVESVFPDGTFLIWEMNGAGGPFTTDERITGTYEFQNFIYL